MLHSLEPVCAELLSPVRCTPQALGRLAQKVDVTHLSDCPSPSSAVPVAKQQAEIGAKLAAIRDVALKCVMAVVAALDHWAVPLKEAQAHALAAARGEGAGSADDGGAAMAANGSFSFSLSGVAGDGDRGGSSPGFPANGGGGHGVSGGGVSGGSGLTEGDGGAERLEAQWAHKSTLSKGVAMFNKSPVKGVKWLVAQGIIPELTPQASLAGCEGG